MWWKSYENETNIFRIYWIQSSSLIVTCELWHCLEQSLGQSHNQDFVWLWHWPKDSRRQCHMPHVTIRGLIVTLAQRLFQAMSQLTCHNQGSDCDIGPKTVPGNVTTLMPQPGVWLWHWPKDCSRQCHNSHVTITRVIVTLAQRLFQAMSHLTCHNIWVGVKKLQKSSSWGGVRPRIYRLSGKVPNPLKYFCFSSKIHFFIF